MSGLYPLTVNTDPAAEPHIYAEDDAAIFQSMFGSDGVCSIGQKCAATVISNNKVRIADGVIIVGGHMARVRYGEYQDCEIMNGQTGYNRNDIIVAKFVTTGSQGTDTYFIEVLQGTAVAGEAVDPVITQGDLYEGDKIRMLPLYRVKIEGLSIVAVEQLFEVIPTIPELQGQVTELNGKIIKNESNFAKCHTFTTDEVDTGETFLGKKVYRRTLVTTSSISGDGGSLILNLNLTDIAGDIWLDTQNSFLRTLESSIVLPVPFNSYNGTDCRFEVWLNRSGIRINSSAGWGAGWQKIITIKYTKL